MAGKAQWSIGMLMVIVLLAAIDFGILRAAYREEADVYAKIFLELPIINLLVLGLLRMRTKPDSRRFWVTFQVVGWLMTAAIALVGWINFDFAASPLTYTFSVFTTLGWVPSRFQEVMVLLHWIVIYGILPALVAAIAGWIRDGYRIRIVKM